MSFHGGYHICQGAYKGLAGDRASMIDYQSDDQPGGKTFEQYSGAA